MTLRDNREVILSAKMQSRIIANMQDKTSTPPERERLLEEEVALGEQWVADCEETVAKKRAQGDADELALWERSLADAQEELALSREALAAHREAQKVAPLQQGD